jgi:hypothetical protein
MECGGGAKKNGVEKSLGGVQGKGFLRYTLSIRRGGSE